MIVSRNNMVSAWYAIAKAEFLVWSSRFRRFRPLVLTLLYAAVIGWALIIAPTIMNYVVILFLSDLELLLADENGKHHFVIDFAFSAARHVESTY